MHNQSRQQISETSLLIQAAHPELPAPPPVFTIKQFVKRNPAFTEAAVWNIRFKSKSRNSSKGPVESNGAASAFLTVGRKVLIDEQAFFDWIRSQQVEAPK